MIIQFVLAAILAILVLQILGQPLFSRLLKAGGLLLAVAGVLFVAFPEVTNSIAHRLGVGRGADLFLYLAITCGSVLACHLYLRIRSLEIRQVELVRQLALQQSQMDEGRAAVSRPHPA